jgi:phosphatidylserine synthase
MGENGGFNFNRLRSGMTKYVNNNEETRAFKKKYNTGVAVGVGAIILTTLAFVYMMFVLTSDFTLTHALLAAAAIVLMIAALIIVPIRLRRLQAEYFSSAGDSANEFVSGFVRKLQEDQQEKAESSQRDGLV